MAGYEIKGYGILLRENMKPPVGNADGTKYEGVAATLKMLNKTPYN